MFWARGVGKLFHTIAQRTRDRLVNSVVRIGESVKSAAARDNELAGHSICAPCDLGFGLASREHLNSS